MRAVLYHDDGTVVVGGTDQRLGAGARVGEPLTIHPLVVQRAGTGRFVVPDVIRVHPPVREMHPWIRVDPEEKPEAERPRMGAAIAFPLVLGGAIPLRPIHAIHGPKTRRHRPPARR